MCDNFFCFLKQLDSVFWGYIAFGLIMVCGTLLTLRSRLFQLRQIPSVLKVFFHALTKPSVKNERGVHPLRAFFASVGGMIGVGNIVGIVTAIQLGGPGALLWVWVTGILGAIVKYSEVYLGIKYRIENKKGSYDGGPMYFLKAAFKNGWISAFVAALLCIYGVEIYLFSVVTESVSTNWSIHRYLVMAGLLFVVFYAGLGGVKRLGKICSAIMPVMVLTYVTLAVIVIALEIHSIPALMATVFKSAFTGHAAVGGFAGSTILLAIQQGMSRAAYSADIGIGFDSIIQSESSVSAPAKQARLAILGVLLDNLVCSASIFLVLISGIWKMDPPIPGSHVVQTVLASYFPYMHIFMPTFLMVAGFTPMIAYFCVGFKCARYLHAKWGPICYLVYATFAFIFFSFFDQSKPLLIMSISGSLLLISNLLGIYKLRKEVSFHIIEEK